MLEKYTYLSELGSGSFGKAWLIKDQRNGKLLVSKLIKIQGLPSIELDRCVTEIAVLSFCRHVNIIRYVEAMVKEGTLHIVMEYANNGDLQGKIAMQKGEPFDKQVILDWFIQVVYALDYIHSKNILHRDIKPQNVFLTTENIIKLGDFGISKVLSSSCDLASTRIGTPFYISPEICQHKPYNSSSDMWAVGCLLYELCMLRVPFKAGSLQELTNHILRCQYAEIPSTFGVIIPYIVSRLLLLEPERRMTARDILQQKFDIVKELVARNKSRNITFISNLKSRSGHKGQRSYSSQRTRSLASEKVICRSNSVSRVESAKVPEPTSGKTILEEENCKSRKKSDNVRLQEKENIDIADMSLSMKESDKNKNLGSLNKEPGILENHIEASNFQSPYSSRTDKHVCSDIVADSNSCHRYVNETNNAGLFECNTITTGDFESCDDSVKDRSVKSASVTHFKNDDSVIVDPEQTKKCSEVLDKLRTEDVKHRKAIQDKGSVVDPMQKMANEDIDQKSNEKTLMNQGRTFSLKNSVARRLSEASPRVLSTIRRQQRAFSISQSETSKPQSLWSVSSPGPTEDDVFLSSSEGYSDAKSAAGQAETTSIDNNNNTLKGNPVLGNLLKRSWPPSFTERSRSPTNEEQSRSPTNEEQPNVSKATGVNEVILRALATYSTDRLLAKKLLESFVKQKISSRRYERLSAELMEMVANGKQDCCHVLYELTPSEGQVFPVVALLYVLEK